MTRDEIEAQLRERTAGITDLAILHQARAEFLLDVIGVSEPDDDIARTVGWVVGAETEDVADVALLVLVATEQARSIAVALEQENHQLLGDNDAVTPTGAVQVTLYGPTGAVSGGPEEAEHVDPGFRDKLHEIGVDRVVVHLHSGYEVEYQRLGAPIRDAQVAAG